MTTGRIHSIETMGLLDGPGIRTIVFLQGCPLRCLYCHNPDTQNLKGGKISTSEELVSMAKRYKPYFERSGGGVTFSGGEPLVQGKFLLESLKQMKAAGIHTALDTSGFGEAAYFDEILQYTDYVLLDLKHFDEKAHQALIGVSMNGRNAFLKALQRFKGRICFRHVMVPGYTDNEAAMDQLAEVIVKYQTVVDKIEVLPYHKMGVQKYAKLSQEDPLKSVEPMDKPRAKELERYLIDRVSALRDAQLDEAASA
jgi:pyruvate formate lyase activating enzyme